MSLEFQEFPKIARFSRECIITEKIDGTNAQVFIRELPDEEVMPTDTPIVAVVGKFLIYAGSRTRWITPEEDNYGFAKWVKENAEELAKLGPGNHFGEWWGLGIQRNYGVPDKRFSLFNSGRWVEYKTELKEGQLFAPTCCRVVPILYSGILETSFVDEAIASLRSNGSQAAPGFMKPEGVIIYHSASKTYFKKTIEKDEEYKGKGK